MSLETLLEAAEFLEARGRELEPRRQRLNSDRRNSVFSEEGSLKDGIDDNEEDEVAFKEPKEKSKQGKMSPIYSGNSDGFVMRAGTREVHNKLEKNRRAHLKECFDFLKKNIPSLEDKRTSNLGILRSSLRYIQNLKRKEKEFELEMQRFAHEKILLQDRMQSLKKDLNKMNIEVDLNAWTSTQEHDNETNSTSTATERGTPPPSDHDENDDDEEEAEKLVMETNPSPTPKLKHKKGTKDVTSHMIKHSNHHKVLSGSNGLVSRPYLSSALKSQSKKTIPITLSLTGPVEQGHSPQKGPQVGVVNNPSGKLSEIPLSRLPVTQILHQTLTQRKALMKQSSTFQMSSAPLTAAQLKSPPMTRPTAPASEGSKFLPTTVSKVMTTTTLQLLPSTVTSIQSSKATTTSTTVPASVSNSGQPVTAAVPSMALPLSLPYYMASMQKISHPILVTSLMAPALGLTTTATPVSSSVNNSTINLASSVIPVKTLSSANVKSEDITVAKVTPATTVSYITTPVLSSTNAQTVTSSVVSNNFPVRPIFAPNLIGGQVAWPFLTAVPRTSIIPTTTVSTTQISTSSSTQVSSVPVVSLAQLNQLTQMMTPVTVMSPGIQVTPTQLNSMIASPLLKQFPFPLGIPSSFLQPGQVLGQQVVKPVVVVTVPNIVSQSSTTVAIPPSVTAVTSSA